MTVCPNCGHELGRARDVGERVKAAAKRVVAAHAAGMTAAEIARREGVARATVYAWVRLAGMKLNQRRRAATRDAAIVAAAEAGRLFTEIAAEHGITRERVRQIISSRTGKRPAEFVMARYGVDPRQVTPEMALAWVRQHGSFANAAKAHGLSAMYLRRALKADPAAYAAARRAVQEASNTKISRRYAGQYGELRERAMELRKMGMGYWEIGRELGRSGAVVHRWIKREGDPLGRKNAPFRRKAA